MKKITERMEQKQIFVHQKTFRDFQNHESNGNRIYDFWLSIVDQLPQEYRSELLNSGVTLKLSEGANQGYNGVKAYTFKTNSNPRLNNLLRQYVVFVEEFDKNWLLQKQTWRAELNSLNKEHS